MSCIHRNVGFAPVEPGFARIEGRPKWTIPWLEDDPAMIQPQLWVGRMRRDAADALWIARAVRRATWRSIGSCAVAAALVVLGVTFGWMTPVVAALCGLATEAWTLRAGSRLLRRVDLRVPMQQ